MPEIHEETLMAVAALFLAGWVIWLVFRRSQLTTQLRLNRTETFNRLIEKFGSTKEFIEFAQSEEGKKLLADTPASIPNPLTKVLRYIQAGVLFIIVGIAYFINAGRWQFINDPNYFHKAEDFNSYGTIAMLLGVGLLIIAGVTYLFIRRWHLANGSGKRSPATIPHTPTDAANNG